MFPRKHLNKWSSQVTNERMIALNQFLSVIIQDPELRNDNLFKDFCSASEDARRQFYENQATTSFKVERVKLREEVGERLARVSKNGESSSTDLRKLGRGGGGTQGGGGEGVGGGAGAGAWAEAGEGV